MTSYESYLYLLLLLVLAVVSAAAQLECGTIGHEVQSEQEKLTNLRFYLNTQNPAPCSGTVTTWKYCYYSPDETADEYTASFGIYRSNDDGRTYQLVSGIFRITIQNDEIGTNQFNCLMYTAPLTLQEGDVIGACVHDVSVSNNAQGQLNLAGSSDSTNLTLLEKEVSGRDGICNNGPNIAVPNSISAGDLSAAPSTILHLYAQIETNEIPTTAPVQGPTTETEETQDTQLSTATTLFAQETTTTEEVNSSIGAIIGGALAAAAVILIIMIVALCVILRLVFISRTKKGEITSSSHCRITKGSSTKYSNSSPTMIPKMEQNKAYGVVSNIPTVDNTAYGCSINHQSVTREDSMEKNHAYKDVGDSDTFNVSVEYDYVRAS